MPKNKGKGGKAFKSGKSKGAMYAKREFIYADPEELEEYGLVKDALGMRNFRVQLAGGTLVIGLVRGAMVHKQIVSPGDVVIVSRREFNEKDKVDIVHRYQPQETRSLIAEGAVPRDFTPKGEKEGKGNTVDNYIDFVSTEVQETKEAKHGGEVFLDVIGEFSPEMGGERDHDDDDDDSDSD